MMLSLILGIIAALADVLGGIILVRREWPKHYLRYFVALGAGFMLAVAFLFWAANQFWANLPQATLFNDIAIALFVLDVLLVMTGWPKTSPDESFAETYVEEAET